MVKAKARYKSKIMIGLKYLVSRINAYEIVEATQLAKELSVDYLQFKALCNNRYSIPNSDLEKINRLINQAKALSTKKFHVHGSLIKTPLKHKCYLTPLHPCIDASANVYLCNLYQHRKKLHTIGNLYKNPFRKIWFSKTHKEKIRNIIPRDCNIYDCIFQRYNRIVDAAILKDRMHIEFI